MTKQWVYAVIVSYLGIMIVVGVSIGYTNYVRDESNQQWCDLMTTLDRAYSSPDAAPTTELGKRVAAAIARLRDTFEC